MTTELHLYLNDDSIPLRKRISRIEQLYARCDESRNTPEPLHQSRAAHGIDTQTSAVLQGVLRRPEPELRWVALSTLACCFPDDATLRDAYIHHLQHDDDDDIRQLAVRVLLENHGDDPTAQAAVVATFDDDDPDMRAAAIYRMGKSATDRAVTVICERLMTTPADNAHDRYWYLRALNNLARQRDVGDMLPHVLAIADDLPIASAVSKLEDEQRTNLYGIAFQVLAFVQRYGDADDLREVIDSAARYNAPMLATSLQTARERLQDLQTTPHRPLSSRLLDVEVPTWKKRRLLHRLADAEPSAIDDADRSALKNVLSQLVDDAPVDGVPPDPQATPMPALALRVLVNHFHAAPELKPRILQLMTATDDALRTTALGLVRYHPTDDVDLVETLHGLLHSGHPGFIEDTLLMLKHYPTPHYAALLLDALRTDTFNPPQRANLLVAIADYADQIDMSTALPTINQMVYELPLHPADDLHATIDRTFAAILKYLRIYADDDTLEAFAHYLSQFEGRSTNAALKIVRATLNAPGKRPRRPTTVPARLDLMLPAPPEEPPFDEPTRMTSPFTLPSTSPLEPPPMMGKIDRIMAFINESVNHMNYDAVPPICQYVQHPTRAVKMAAIRALGTFGDGRARATLEKALDDENPAIRKLALNALGKLRH
jgi:hypothetical protein